MAAIIRLNIDNNSIIIVKPDQQVITFTGATTHLVNVGGGEQIYKGMSGSASEIRTLIAGANMSITTSGNTIIFDSGITDGTFQILGSGNTIVTNPSGNTWIVYTPSGTSYSYVGSGNTTVTQSGNTYIIYSPTGGTSSITLSGSGNTTVTQSGNTWIIYSPTGGTGVSSWNDLTDKPSWLSATTLSAFQTGHTHAQYALQSGINTYTGTTAPLTFANKIDFNNHTGDTTIHYPQSAITITESQVTNLVNDLAGKSNTGHTHSQYLTGITCIDVTGCTDGLYANISHIHAISDVTGLQTALDDKSNTGHTHSQYLTGITCSDITGCTDGLYALIAHTHAISDVTGLQAALDGKSDTGHTHSQYALQTAIDTYTGTTAPLTFANITNFNNHTGDTTIHFKQSGITITESQVTNLVTDLASKSNTGHTHSQYLTGFTVTCDMVTGCTDSLYAAKAHTHSYNDLDDLPSLFSGDYDDLTNKPDLSVYQPVSGMSAYLTGVTWNDVTNKPDLTLQSDFTGLTESFNSHTGDTSIHFTKASLNSTFVNVTGDTMTGALQINDNGTTGTTANWLRINSANKTWSDGGEEVGRIDFWVTDTSGVGEHTGAQIAILNALAGQTTPRCDMVFKTGFNEEAIERMRIDYQGNVKIQTLLSTIKNVTSTTYTLLTTDSGKILQLTATGATTITIPSGSTFLEGFQCTLVSYGNGTISGVKTIAAQSGATVKSKNSALKLATIFGAATIYKTPTANTWVVFGDLTA